MSEFSEIEMPEVVGREPGSRGRIWAASVVLMVILVTLAAYAFHEHSLAGKLSTQNNEIASSLNTTRAQIDALTAKINALTAPQPEKPAAAQPASNSSTNHPAHRRTRAEDPRWRQVRSQLAEHQKQIDSTQQDLANTRTELQGSIARTHDELVVLQKRGERNYYEFDLDKSGQFQREGPFGVRLRKANTKHEYADLELMVDDYKLSKKHVNIFEPVMFYNADNGRPVELVINSVSKNHIHGYVSEPRYKSGDLDAMANNTANGTTPANANPGNSSAAPNNTHQRLQLPKPDNQN
jgi:outer membrane murein-binding lipoprotein Lpp